MRAHLQQLWIAVQASYWFWPSLMAVAALILASVTTEIDSRIGADWPEQLPFVYSNQPDGARALLSTVAGSMITVTGITFSLTLLAVSHATSQFGPRLLTNFMRDRGNQITLGTFIATFLYCLMVLRTVRSAEESSGTGGPTNDLLGAFVPHVSIFTAILLTILSVGVLIYFIHHIPESIRLSNVVANVGRELTRSIPELFPEMMAEEQPDEEQRDPRQLLQEKNATSTQTVTSATDGYLQTVDEQGLLNFAMQQDAVLEMRAVPGDFVSCGQPLLLVASSESLDERAEEELRFMFAFGSHRTSKQNALFLVDQLVEVAARALSPGINDPMTAKTSMDWMQSALLLLVKRDDPASFRFDMDGTLRVIASAATFQDFSSHIFDQLRPYVAQDRNAAIHMMTMIANVLAGTRAEKKREILMDHADQLLAAAEQSNLFPQDLDQLRQIQDGFCMPQEDCQLLHADATR